MKGEPKKGDRHFRAFYLFLPKRAVNYVFRPEECFLKEFPQ
jgi:hypothetical protein